MSYTLALDIGATKIAWGLFGDSLEHSGRLATQPHPREQVIAAVREAAAHGPIARVGVGAPGIVEHGIVAHAGPTLPGWKGTNLEELVRQAGVDAPIKCANDVRVWAVGEHARNPIPGRVLYISLGTGVGGAVVDKHELLEGAGEMSELTCADYTGRARRAEDVASGPALARACGGTDLRAELHNTKVIAGNMRGFGRMLGGLVSGFGLDAVVLGGGVAGIGELITEPLREGLIDATLAPHKHVPVLVTGAGSQLAAAAEFARHHEGESQ